MRDGLDREFPTPNSNGFGDDYSRLQSRRCPSMCRHLGTSRFGSPLVLSRVHWVRPELVAEVKFLTWTQDGLLRQVIYQGVREDKPAKEVRRPTPRQ
jgi:bifunctional non-homologous end joining protein LigD